MTVPYPTIPGVTFKDIEGYPGYCVGDDGSIWSRRRPGPTTDLDSAWRRLKPATQRNRAGHKYVSFRLNGRLASRFVHRLVLEAFVGSAPEGMECCHNNGDPSDNRLENLRWDTRLANRADAITHGTQVRGSRQGRSKLTEELVREIVRLHQIGCLGTEIAVRIGVSKSSVNLILVGKTWRHVTDSLTRDPENDFRTRKRHRREKA